MNLQNEVQAIMSQSEKWLTVEEVTQRVADRMEGEIRAILNALVKEEQLELNPGAAAIVHVTERAL